MVLDKERFHRCGQARFDSIGKCGYRGKRYLSTTRVSALPLWLLNVDLERQFLEALLGFDDLRSVTIQAYFACLSLTQDAHAHY
jgi:hypothetical protein